jgi:hypothetical protein
MGVVVQLLDEQVDEAGAAGILLESVVVVAQEIQAPGRVGGGDVSACRQVDGWVGGVRGSRG